MHAAAYQFASNKRTISSRPPAESVGRDRQDNVGPCAGRRPGAFGELVTPYCRELQLHCYRILGSFPDAEDVLQEVFTAAFNAILADEREINVRPWLYRIARNRSLNHLRRASGMAGTGLLRRPFAPGVALPHRHQPLPQSPPSCFPPPAARALARPEILTQGHNS